MTTTLRISLGVSTAAAIWSLESFIHALRALRLFYSKRYDALYTAIVFGLSILTKKWNAFKLLAITCFVNCLAFILIVARLKCLSPTMYPRIFIFGERQCIVYRCDFSLQRMKSCAVSMLLATCTNTSRHFGTSMISYCTRIVSAVVRDAHSINFLLVFFFPFIFYMGADLV